VAAAVTVVAEIAVAETAVADTRNRLKIEFH